MNRRQFVTKTAGAAAATVVGTGAVIAGTERASKGAAITGKETTSESTGRAPSAQNHMIKRGVSLYSYQMAIMINGMKLEDMIEEVSNIGAYGIEAMGQVIVENYPNPSEKWLGMWWDLMDRYGTVPVCYTDFHDQNLRKARPMTTEENLEYLKRDLILARKMGFNRMRMLIGTPHDLIKAAIPVAEHLGIWMGLEIHAPVPLNSKLIDRCVEIADKHPNTFGLLPDMGIFQRYPRPYTRETEIKNGTLTLETAIYIEESFKKGIDREEVEKQVAKMKPKPGDTGYVETVYRSDAAYQNPRDLLPLLKYCRHIHGKFYEMSKGDKYYDTTVDYENVIPVLIEGGYNGYICSEYEGQRSMEIADVDEIDEIRRQHVMLKRMLGD